MEQLEDSVSPYYLPDEGLKILLVGDDVITALIRALSPPHYCLTGCVNATSAFELLSHSSYDLVLSDIFLPDMDGIDFIREQCLRTNIPHVAICSERLSDIRAAFRHGACYVLRRLYINKIELRNLLQNVYRRREQCRSDEPGFTTIAATNDNNNNSIADGDHQQHNGLVIRQEHQHSGANPNNIGNGSEFMNNVGDPSLRRQRVVWDERLESIFVEVVNRLGGEKNAVPKAILEAMNVPYLTREHVASHLQKYRMKKNAEKRRHPFGQGEREPDAMIYYPPPENPNTHHLLEPSTNDFHHLTHLQRQMQMEPSEENVGPVVPMPSSLPVSGSNMQRLQDVTQNLVGSMRQVEQNPGSTSFYGDQNLPMNTSFGSNMQLQHIIQDPGGSHENNMQHQSLASGSSHVTMTGGLIDNGIINPEAHGSSTFAPDDQIL